MIQIPMRSLVVAAFVSNAVVVTQVAGFHISFEPGMLRKSAMIPEFTSVFQNIAEGYQ
jgi:hypothetical protein